MNRVVKFVPRPYRNRKTRKEREIEAEKILKRREAIAEKRQKAWKEKKKSEGIIPPTFAKLGEEIARIPASDQQDIG